MGGAFQEGKGCPCNSADDELWPDCARHHHDCELFHQMKPLMCTLLIMRLQGGVCTFLYKDVFSSNSKTVQFNRAVDRVKDDSRCIALLGDPKKIRAYGETSWNKWTRNRPVA